MGEFLTADMYPWRTGGLESHRFDYGRLIIAKQTEHEGTGSRVYRLDRQQAKALQACARLILRNVWGTLNNKLAGGILYIFGKTIRREVTRHRRKTLNKKRKESIKSTWHALYSLDSGIAPLSVSLEQLH